MKKKLLFVLPLIAAFTACGVDEAENIVSRYRIENVNGLPTVYNLGTGGHVTYLMMSRYGYLDLDGTKTYGETVPEKFLEYAISWNTNPNGDLPEKEVVKSKVSGSTFRGWAKYLDNTYPDYLTKVPTLSGECVYAIFDGESGGGTPVTPTGEVITYTVTNFPDWMPNDGACVFAWAWGGDAGGGKWYTITLNYQGSDNNFTNVTGTFNAPNNITGFNMARCKAGTLAPNWTVTGDNPGRVYNKTDDVKVTRGVTSYASPAWVEYSYNPQ